MVHTTMGPLAAVLRALALGLCTNTPQIQDWPARAAATHAHGRDVRSSTVMGQLNAHSAFRSHLARAQQLCDFCCDRSAWVQRVWDAHHPSHHPPRSTAPLPPQSPTPTSINTASMTKAELDAARVEVRLLIGGGTSTTVPSCWHWLLRGLLWRSAADHCAAGAPPQLAAAAARTTHPCAAAQTGGGGRR
jgi:hypothetical protein